MPALPTIEIGSKWDSPVSDCVTIRKIQTKDWDTNNVYYEARLDPGQPSVSLAIVIETIKREHPLPHRLRVYRLEENTVLIRVEPKALTPRQIQKALAALPVVAGLRALGFKSHQVEDIYLAVLKAAKKAKHEPPQTLGEIPEEARYYADLVVGGALMTDIVYVLRATGRDLVYAAREAAQH